MNKVHNKIKLLIKNYTGECAKCGAYYLDDEDVCQVCGWPYTD